MYTEDIWSALFAHAECPEEGTRNVVAECLGRLTLANPEKFLPRLKAALSSDSNLLRTTVVTAVKFTIVDQPQPIDPLLKENIGDFLSSLVDPDINVRRVALVAFNSAAHNKPALIRDLLPQLLPKLYLETQVRVRFQNFCFKNITFLILNFSNCFDFFQFFAERANPRSGNGTIQALR